MAKLIDEENMADENTIEQENVTDENTIQEMHLINVEPLTNTETMGKILSRGVAYTEGAPLYPFSLHMNKGNIFDPEKLANYLEDHSEETASNTLEESFYKTENELNKSIAGSLTGSGKFGIALFKFNLSANVDYQSSLIEKTTASYATKRLFVNLFISSLPDGERGDDLRQLCTEEFQEQIDSIETKYDAERLLVKYGVGFVTTAKVGGIYGYTAKSNDNYDEEDSNFKASFEAQMSIKMEGIKFAVEGNASGSTEEKDTEYNHDYEVKQTIVGGNRKIISNEDLKPWYNSVEENPKIIGVQVTPISVLGKNEKIRDLIFQALIEQNVHYLAKEKQCNFLLRNHVTWWNICKNFDESELSTLPDLLNMVPETLQPFIKPFQIVDNDGKSIDQEMIDSVLNPIVEQFGNDLEKTGAKNESCYRFVNILESKMDSVAKDKKKNIFIKLCEEFRQHLPFRYLFNQNVSFQSIRYSRHIKLENNAITGSTDAEILPIDLKDETETITFKLIPVSTVVDKPICALYNEDSGCYIGVNDEGNVYTVSEDEASVIQDKEDIHFQLRMGNTSIDGSVLIYSVKYKKVLSMEELKVSGEKFDDQIYNKIDTVSNELFFVRKVVSD